MAGSSIDSPHKEAPRKSRSYKIVKRKWPQVARKGIIWLMPLELIGLVPILVIFGISQPDLYRSKMWQIGFDNQLNSDPNMIIYAIANFQPPPNIPLVWSKVLTDFNVAISIISLFFLLARLIAYIMKMWYPVASVFVSTALTALYAVSVYGQVGPDYADSRYPAPAAWYFRKGCNLAKPYGAYSNCQMAQSSLGITLYVLVLYVLNLGFSFYAMLPNQINDVDEDDEDDMYVNSNANASSYGPQYALNSPIRLQDSPFTPRTQAFHTLDRKIPQQNVTVVQSRTY